MIQLLKMKLIGKSIAIIVILATLRSTEGHGDGAPVTSCANLAPAHIKDNAPISAQPESTFPYTLSFAAVEEEGKIGSGDPMTLKLSSNFQGFLIEARQGESPIGTFDVMGDANIKTIDCGSGQKNAITHTNPTVKESISATWTPPADFDDLIPVEFHVTVAQDHDIFWVDHVVTI